MLNAIKKNGATLALFACATTGLVAITHYLTKDTIQRQEQAQLIKTLNQVVPKKLHDNALFSSCTLVNDPKLGVAAPQPAYLATLDGIPTAIAIESYAPDGYSGLIKIITGIAYDGTVLGVRVLHHQETPGLGDKIELRISDWITSFTGRTLTDENRDRWKVQKDGGDFDQFTGATITPRAVVKAVKNTVDFINQNRDTIFTQPLDCAGAK